MMDLVNYNELIDSWNNTLNVLAKIADVPVALAMRVDKGNISVFSKNDAEQNPYHIGDSEPLLNSGLYCEHVIKSKQLLKVPNALLDPNWCDNPDIKLNMIAYLGLPILDGNDSPFGTICILDSKRREFSATTIELLETIRESFETQLKVLHQQHIIDENLHHEELTTLIRGISHEINTPLGTAITSSSIIEADIEEVQQSLHRHTLTQKKLTIKLASLEQSIASINKVLHQAATKVSTLQNLLIEEVTGTQQLLQLDKLIKDTLRGYQQNLAKYQVQCSFHCDKQENFELYLASNLVQEVLVVLLNNSLIHAFVNITKPIINIELTKQGHSFQIHYKDNGIGIDKDIAQRVFNPFFTTNRQNGHIGLGLSVIRRIVRLQLGGDVQLQPVSSGVYFIITLPEQASAMK